MDSTATAWDTLAEQIRNLAKDLNIHHCSAIGDPQKLPSADQLIKELTERRRQGQFVDNRSKLAPCTIPQHAIDVLRDVLIGLSAIKECDTQAPAIPLPVRKKMTAIAERRKLRNFREPRGNRQNVTEHQLPTPDATQER